MHLLISILVLPFSGKAAIDHLYDIPYWCIFLLFIWDYRQIFRCNWWQSLWPTVRIFFYNFLIILLIAAIVVALYIPSIYFLKAIGV